MFFFDCKIVCENVTTDRCCKGKFTGKSIINIDTVLFYIIQLNKVTFSGGASFTVVKNKCVQVKTEQWISNETAFKA